MLKKIFFLFGIAVALSVPSYASAHKAVQLAVVDMDEADQKLPCGVRVSLIEPDGYPQIFTEVGSASYDDADTQGPRFLKMNVDGMPLKLKQLGDGPALSHVGSKEGKFYSFHYVGDQVFVDLRLKYMGSCGSLPGAEESSCESDVLLGTMTAKSHQHKSTYKVRVDRGCG